MEETGPTASTPAAPIRWNGWRVTAVVLIGVAALYLVQIIIGVVIVGAVFVPKLLANPHQNLDPQQIVYTAFNAPGLFLISVSSETVMALVAIGLATTSLGATRAQLGLGRAFRASDLGIGILAGVALVGIGSLADNIQKKFLGDHPQAAMQLIMTHHGALSFALDFVSVALAAGVCEEIMFRGVLFGSLMQRLPVWAAAVISGVAFGLAHGDPWNLGVLACVGIGLAMLYSQTRSLWPNMVAHTTFNAVSLVVIYWLPQYAK